ncbi:MAG: acetyl-CoA carboxylase biotin carboxyl carrier protein [Acidobacteria bacterium]|nr:acetyl-CoA carboxylase biotin carboxyl carrier protein [Acidobacteriota bacterium]MBI3662863.1 acetyl-CoA carboxylase biotin carboxyl carrier protein [Acidobacteriota bacterium]
MAKKPKETPKETRSGGQAAPSAALPSPPLGKSGTSGADLSLLERMLAFMEQHGLEEFEYENAGLRVRLRKPAMNAHHAAPSRGLGAIAPPEILVAGPVASPPPARAGESGEAVRSESSGEDLYVVKSPIVGTFYEAGSPGAEPFIKVGDQVSVGQVLCIIEAMKLMNEIESDAAGEIVRRYVENGQPVEYGESLFAIRPSRKK